MVTDWSTFEEQYQDTFMDMALLLNIPADDTLLQDKNPGLRGVIKGHLTEALGEDDGRFFLDSLWGIRSTMDLSTTQGVILGMWLRDDGNKEELPQIVEELRQWSESPPPETVEQAAAAMGAEVKPLDVSATTPTIETIADMVRPEEGDALRLAEMPEAPASVNFLVSLHGVNTQWTLRDWNEADLLVRVDKLLDGLSELGAVPVDRYGNSTIRVAEAQATASTTTPTAPPQRPAQPQTPPLLLDGCEKYAVREIVARTTPNNNPYYAVMGGRYMKYGVTAWPEVAAQVDGLFDDVHLEDLAIGESWSAAGRNLFALAEKPADKEFANKVIEFVIG